MPKQNTTPCRLRRLCISSAEGRLLMSTTRELSWSRSCADPWTATHSRTAASPVIHMVGRRSSEKWQEKEINDKPIYSVNSSSFKRHYSFSANSFCFSWVLMPDGFRPFEIMTRRRLLQAFCLWRVQLQLNSWFPAVSFSVTQMKRRKNCILLFCIGDAPFHKCFSGWHSECWSNHHSRFR